MRRKISKTTAVVALCLAGAWGCTGTVESAGGTAGHTASPGAPGTGGGTSAGSGGGTSAGSGATGTTPDATCTRDPVVAPRRLVRLTLRQITTSIGRLLGAELATEIEQQFEVPPLGERAFPPLSSQQEGTFLTEGLWAKSEGIAKAAAQYVSDNYQRLTGCSATDTTDACAEGFVRSFAQKAFRRPLDAEESASLMQVYTESKSFGSTVSEALQQATWAILSSPHFLYRRELGATDAILSGVIPMTSYELASALSFFLTDGPPDQQMLDSAADGSLSTETGLASHVDRLIGESAVQANLEQAVFAYFGISNIDSVVIDPAVAPDFTVGLRNAMRRETQDFLHAALFGGVLGDLLTSRRSVVNPDLALLYGVEFPAGAARTPDTFVPVELPPVRAGLLTQAAFLTARARPDEDSVVGRGLLVSATLLCAQNPEAPPDALAPAIEAASEALADKTEREKAEYRLTTQPCGSCHRNFDAYGLVLENYDLIGRYRTTDPEGRPIDPTAMLPPALGGALVTGAADMAQKLAREATFATCMTRNLMKYALAEGNVDRSDCAVQEVSRKFVSGPQTFSNLIRQIALSKTLGFRTNGASQ